MMISKKYIYPFLLLFFIGFIACESTKPEINLITVEKGWAKNSVNTVVFRRNALVSHHGFQYTAFYDSTGHVILAKRKSGSSRWQISKTQYNGNVKDAHNSISIMMDGEGYLHMAWDHHGNPLRYCRGLNPESLELSDEMEMTGVLEQNVTYPEFHRLADGNLLFLFRDGSSGNGNLVMNYYNAKEQIWINLHQNLIDGEAERNAYWQAATGSDGSIHLSWVWRESWDVATNHDICYAKSLDGGQTWQKSNGEYYSLPITAETAEYAAYIPQKSELINQTSMCVNQKGYVCIANYWRPEGSEIPQYHLVYHDSERWQIRQISNRKTAFSLSGGGTKRIPVSRPKILMDNQNTFYLLFRDAERGNRVSLSICSDLKQNIWKTMDLTRFSVKQWEPTFDTELWKKSHELNIFVQSTGQGDAETTDDIPPQMVYVLEYTSP